MKRFWATLLTLVILAVAVPAALAAEAPAGYYGSRLTDPAAISFYQALAAMDFTSGGNLTVEDPAVIELAETFAEGDDTLIRSFGAAVDSFRYDHTEFFYVDWDMLSVNVGIRNGQFVVKVGTGRTDSYLRDKTADLNKQIADYNAALEAMAADVRTQAGANASVQDIARIANDVVCEAVTYDFCDGADGRATVESKYIRTAYGALVNGKAVCEGYARLYKAVLNKLGIACELVSGYFLEGESFEPHMWNYVQDEKGHWYAVDVTMNDGHRLQAGNGDTGSAKYFWQTEELFASDHIEDGKVSSVEYLMPYPELHSLWQSPASSGGLVCGIKNYNGSQKICFSYNGKSADELLKEDGLYLALRTLTTNTGTPEWSPWQSVQEYNRQIPGSVLSVGHETYFLMDNTSMSTLEVGVFDIPDDENRSNTPGIYSYAYSDEAVRTHLIETAGAENSDHDADYITPPSVKYTIPTDLFQVRQNILQMQHIVLEYNMPLKETGNGLELTWYVSSPNDRDLSLEAVQQNARLENVQFDGDRTISFDFTPSRAYNHNMIFYHFTPQNVLSVLPNGSDGVPLKEFSIMYEYKNSFACCKIYNDGRLYMNSYAQPSLAMNGDLSTTGWKYTDVDANGQPVERLVSESQRSQMALVVTPPQNSSELADAVTNKAGSAVVQSKTYEIDLNICGKLLQIPNGSYMKLNLGIPDEFAGLAGLEDIKFKLYHFKRDAAGNLDYANPQEIDCVVTPYGIIAEVNSFSPYVLAAVKNSMLPPEQQNNAKGIALVCNGHGGRVESSIPAVSTLAEGETATYTLKPATGYEVDFARLNGADITPAGNTVTLAYADLQSNNTLEIGFVATSVKEAEKAENIENVKPNSVYTVAFDTNGGSLVATARVKCGAKVAKPANPTKQGFSFDGWYTDQALTSAYDFNTPVVNSMTLYAKWQKTSETPTHSSGGSHSRPKAPSPKPQTPSTPTPAPSDPDKPAAWQNPFADVQENAWYYQAVQFVASNGLFLGTGETEFTPSGNMTRGMLATVLYRLAKEPEVTAGPSFNDVAAGQYYAKAVTWAAAKDIVRGYGNGSFEPGDFITREQLAVMLWRYAGSPAGSASLDSFTDGNQTAAWAVEALQWAVEQKLINGRDNGSLDLKGKATRAEVAAILLRYCETVK